MATETRGLRPYLGRDPRKMANGGSVDPNKERRHCVQGRSAELWRPAACRRARRQVGASPERARALSPGTTPYPAFGAKEIFRGHPP